MGWGSFKYEWWRRDFQLQNGDIAGKVRYKFIPKGPMYEIEMITMWPRFAIPNPSQWNGRNPGDLPNSARQISDYLDKFRGQDIYPNADGTRCISEFNIVEPAPRETRVLVYSVALSGSERPTVVEFEQHDRDAYGLLLHVRDDWLARRLRRLTTW